MSIFNSIFAGHRGSTNNNRKATRGRISAGKSTYKGMPAEENVVRHYKKVEEKSRMLVAVEIKLKNNPGDEDLKREKEGLTNLLVSAIEDFQLVAPQRYYEEKMRLLDKEDTHRREKYGLPNTSNVAA